MPFARFTLLSAFLLLCGLTALAADPLPKPPTDFVLDAAGVLSPGQKSALSAKLAQFERDTSNQIWVCVLPEVPADYAMEDFTQRTAEAWGVGQKEKDNGIVLFVFPKSRAMRIEVGYGLEGAVPDGLANIIIQDEMVPAFRGGDLPGGIDRGVDALIDATRGEYHGTGRTKAEEQGGGNRPPDALFWLIFIAILIFVTHRNMNGGGTVYSPRGRRDVFSPGFGGGFGSGGGGWSSGGGGFGGGSFGGGGASGRW